MKYTLLSLAICLSFACNSHKELPQQKSFDSLFAMVKSCDSSYQAIDWKKVMEVERAVQQDVQSISDKKIRLKKEKKEIVEQYTALQWFGKSSEDNPINAFNQSQNMRFLKKQIDYSKAQINNLYADAKAENLKDDKLKEYLATERKAITDLYTFTKQKALNYEAGISQFDELKPKVDEILSK